MGIHLSDALVVRALLHGMLALGAWACALFFLRFWYASRDRLFVLFATAFGLLGLNWAAQVLVDVELESRHYLFLLRLVAFVLILVAIWEKNRTRPPRRAR